MEIATLISKHRSITIKNTLRMIGAYGIVQVFAQDVGIETNYLQKSLIQNIFVQIVLFTSVAYSISDDFFQSLSGTLLYFILKHGTEKMNKINTKK
jgi:hypothetical protein